MSLSSVRPLLHLALCVIRADGLQHYDMSGGAKDQTVGTGCGKMGVSMCILLGKRAKVICLDILSAC